MKGKVKVAQFGLGPIGLECLKLLATQDWARIVGAVDLDPKKVKPYLDRLQRNGSLPPFQTVARLEELPERPELIFHTAVSSFKSAYQQLLPVVRRGINVVSSCEELIFPALSEPDLAAGLDKVCRESGARVIGAGVNPGFVMDLLPLCLAGVTTEIKTIHVERVVNASTRRDSLQRKIGSGMEPNYFTKLLRAGRAGHAGLKESVALLAHSLTGATGKVRETGKAVVARAEIRTRYVKVLKGQTCGLHQKAETTVNGKLHVQLDLKMYLGAEDPHDAIQIEGNPPVCVTIPGGVAGDQATVAALVNTAWRMLRMPPGLKLLSELGLAVRPVLSLPR